MQEGEAEGEPGTDADGELVLVKRLTIAAECVPIKKKSKRRMKGKLLFLWKEGREEDSSSETILWL